MILLLNKKELLFNPNLNFFINEKISLKKITPDVIRQINLNKQNLKILVVKFCI